MYITGWKRGKELLLELKVQLSDTEDHFVEGNVGGQAGVGGQSPDMN